MEKKWILRPEAASSLIDKLSNDINVSKPIANLLIQRGIKTFEEAKNFFRPNLDKLHDPFLMQDMGKAISRIEEAIKNQEKVMVYGDYDVDGTTSVSLMYSFLKDKLSYLDYYIPNRYSEGYGISFQGIDTADQKGVSLIIALDCGIKAIEKVDYASEKNIDFIICDHHEPGNELPKAVAVLDPKRKDCAYPFKELSACGVGFKLIQAYIQKNNIPFSTIKEYLDLVVVSIASDIVPIVDENRILAYYGLKQINNHARIGLKAILNIANVKAGNLRINDLVFKVGPRINAAGRIQQGQNAVDLLVSNDVHSSSQMAQKIDGDNTQRKEFDSSITKEALQLIENNDELKSRKSTILYNPEWHKGVIGIVASRVIDHYYRPTIILTKSNGFVTGSARSVDGFNVYKAIDSCRDLLENFGGHMYAAGLTLKEEKVDEFKERFETYVQENIEPESLIPKIEIDNELEIVNINKRFLAILEQFEPFGPGNMSPTFVSRNIYDTGHAHLIGVHNDHLKMYVSDNSTSESLGAIAFKQSKQFDVINSRQRFDMCYSIEENLYKGKTSIQLKVRDIKPSEFAQ